MVKNNTHCTHNTINAFNMLTHASQATYLSALFHFLFLLFQNNVKKQREWVKPSESNANDVYYELKVTWFPRQLRPILCSLLPTHCYQSHSPMYKTLSNCVQSKLVMFVWKKYCAHNTEPLSFNGKIFNSMIHYKYNRKYTCATNKMHTTNGLDQNGREMKESQIKRYMLILYVEAFVWPKRSHTLKRLYFLNILAIAFKRKSLFHFSFFASSWASPIRHSFTLFLRFAPLHENSYISSVILHRIDFFIAALRSQWLKFMLPRWKCC